MNQPLNYNLLKRLYSIHSPSGREQGMTRFLVSYLKSLPGNIKLGKDTYGNLYAIKGESETYPCIVAHLDQVQREHSRDFKATETRDIIFGYSPTTHAFEGLGADDKNGILIALEALKHYPAMKAAFFKEEETGCKGSENAEMTFFKDCRYVIQCDRRGSSDLITSIGFTDLCSEDFIRAANPEQWGYSEENGLMTDVETLKERGLEVSAVNMSCGYYNTHTDEEICHKRDLEKCWHLVQHIIEDCTDTYPHTAQHIGYADDYEWEVEEELYSLLQQDPGLTGSDLYDMYHTNFPNLTQEGMERIVEEYHALYEDDEPFNPEDHDEKKDRKRGGKA